MELLQFERVTNEKYLHTKIYEGKYIFPIHNMYYIYEYKGVPKILF